MTVKKKAAGDERIPEQVTVMLGPDGSSEAKELADILAKNGHTVRKPSGKLNTSMIIRYAISIALKTLKTKPA